MDPDGIDNPRFDNNGNQLCNESVNGINFGDTIVDNERFGMSHFIYCNNSNSGVPYYMQDPLFSFEYYNMMQGVWKDSTHLFYGGFGNTISGGYGPACNFMFPGESDTLNWGVGCQAPNGPVNWTEETAHSNPSDRRCMMSTGPFTFAPGDVQEFDVCFTFARDYINSDPHGSVEKLRNRIDVIRQAFESNKLPGGEAFYNTVKDFNTLDENTIQIYPNPAGDHLTLLVSNQSVLPEKITLFTPLGKVVQVFTPAGRGKDILIRLDDIKNGVYLLNIQTNRGPITKKLIIAR